MKKILCILLVFAVQNSVSAQIKKSKSLSIQPMSISEVLGMTLRSDGHFDVTCIDGSIEIRTQQEILDNKVCVFEKKTIKWSVETSVVDMKFCDLNTVEVTRNNKIVSFTANFMSPCLETNSNSAVCVDRVCNLKINNVGYKLDFTLGEDILELTRASDGLRGRFAKFDK